MKAFIENLSPETRRAVGIVIAAFVGGVLTAFMAAGGDVFALDLRSLVNAGVGAAATVVAAWLLPLYKGIGVGHTSELSPEKNNS